MTDMLPVLINGRWELLLPEHRAARPQWKLENGGWEKERLAAEHDTITSLKDPLVFVCGAEEGDFPALYASWGARVVLFEPNPLVWPNIRAIWEANELPPPAGWHVGFASDRTVSQPPRMEPIFAEPDRDGWPACAYGPVIGDHGFRNVCERAHDTPQVSIDDFPLTPDVLTLDVEGAELVVLKGAAETLRSDRPVVFVSIHPSFLKDMYGQSDADVHAYMASHGYVGTHLATDHEEHYRFDPH